MSVAFHQSNHNVKSSPWTRCQYVAGLLDSSVQLNVKWSIFSGAEEFTFAWSNLQLGEEIYRWVERLKSAWTDLQADEWFTRGWSNLFVGGVIYTWVEWFTRSWLIYSWAELFTRGLNDLYRVEGFTGGWNYLQSSGMIRDWSNLIAGGVICRWIEWFVQGRMIYTWMEWRTKGVWNVFPLDMSSDLELHSSQRGDLSVFWPRLCNC